jgi:hypothetical protein
LAIHDLTNRYRTITALAARSPIGRRLTARARRRRLTP